MTQIGQGTELCQAEFILNMILLELVLLYYYDLFLLYLSTCMLELLFLRTIPPPPSRRYRAIPALCESCGAVTPLAITFWSPA